MKPHVLIHVLFASVLLATASAQEAPETETFQIRRVAVAGSSSEHLRWASTIPGQPDVPVESSVLLDTSALRSVRVVPQDKGSFFDLMVSFTDAGRAAFDAVRLASISAGSELVWIIDGVVVRQSYPVRPISPTVTELHVFARLTEADANRMADHIKQRLARIAQVESGR
jgi:hypothetical protein